MQLCLYSHATKTDLDEYTHWEVRFNYFHINKPPESHVTTSKFELFFINFSLKRPKTKKLRSLFYLHF